MKPEREYQMSDNVDLFINLNDKNDADKVLTIIKREASKITPEYPTEIERFIDGIQVEGNTVKTEANYSLVIGSFFELMPKIMMEIAVGSFGPITMEAAFFTDSCGYEAYFSGRIFKNGKFRMSFYQHE